MPATTLIELTDQERVKYQQLCRVGKISVRMKERLSVVMLANEGLTNGEIAELVPMNPHAVGRWRIRYSEGG